MNLYRNTSLVYLLAALVGCAGQPTTPPTPDETAETPRPTGEARAETGATTPGEQLGRVHFQPSCNEEAQAHFEQGLSRLHHMWYVKARESFEQASSADPSCAMAQWGLAMTYYTPLWAKPEDKELEAGARAAARAAELEAPTDRERAFVAAVEAFYRDHARRDHEERAIAFRDAWQQAHRRDPSDVEAAAFYALSILSTVPALTENFDEHERAGAILEDVLRREPLHPGGHHYLIHAYDNPKLAERAVPVARRYADIAPSVPHALHMPSHIFTRLGLWEDNAEWNLRSADVAAEHPVDGKTSLHFYHAIDYVVYADLQMARDRHADELVERARRADMPQPHPAAAYASVAIPARIAMERRDWQAAAQFEALHPDALPWAKWPFMEAITHTVRAVGHVHLGDLDAARGEVDHIARLEDASADKGEAYWAAQVAIYHDVASALIDEAEGRNEEALDTLRAAAEAQESLQKHPITPGRIIEVHDYLAEMLRRAELPAEALQVYERSLEVIPNRFRAVYGAASTARETGDQELARQYYAQLIELAGEGDGTRPELTEARAYLEARRVARSAAPTMR